MERNIVINDIHQENEKLLEDRSNDILQFHKLDGYMEEILIDFEVVVNIEARTGGKYIKIRRALRADNL